MYSVKTNNNVEETAAVAAEIAELAIAQFSSEAEKLTAGDSSSSFDVTSGKTGSDKIYVRCTYKSTSKSEAIISLMDRCHNYISTEFKNKRPV